MSELKSYITTYDIEYIVQLNDFTEVVIRTQYTNPSMIARPEDKDEVARVDYTNTKNTLINYFNYFNKNFYINFFFFNSFSS